MMSVGLRRSEVASQRLQLLDRKQMQLNRQPVLVFQILLMVQCRSTDIPSPPLSHDW